MKQGFFLALIVSLQLAFNFLTQIIIIRFLGLSSQTDSFVAAQIVPMVISGILIAALQSVWLPKLAANSGDELKWEKTLAAALGQTIILSFFCNLALIMTVNYWLPLLFPGFSVIQKEHTGLYVIILAIASFFSIQSAQLTIALRVKGHFYANEFINLFGVSASFVLIAVVISPWGLHGVVSIILGRSLLTFFMQLMLAKWPKISIKSGFRDRDAWSLMKPIFAGASLYKTSPLVDRFWASLAPSGILTIYNLAQTAIVAISTILDRSINAPLTAKFGTYVKNGDYEALTIQYRKGIRNITIVTALIALLLVAFKELIVLAFEVLLKLQPEMANTFWLLLIMLFGHLYVSVAGVVLVAVYYALGDTRTPSIIGILGFFIGIFLKWLLFASFGVQGLAFASSIYFVFNFLLFVLFLEPKLRGMRTCGILTKAPE